MTRDGVDAIGEILAQAAATLASSSDSPRLDAELLLCHVLECPRSHLFAWPERAVSAPLRRGFETLMVRRRQGVPLAYLLGRREFWSLSLRVSSHTLVPRPDTERLVETALNLLALRKRPRLLDLGTGTGAVALALAQERPDAEITAVELSAEALAIAQTNAFELGLNQVRFRQGDWFRALAPTRSLFDLIVSNPPYVASEDPALQDDGVRHEPRLALVAGPDGLAELRRIVADAPAHLLPGGWLVLEHGSEQGDAVQALLLEAGLEAAETLSDFGGMARVSRARRAPNSPAAQALCCCRTDSGNGPNQSTDASPKTMK